MNIKELDLNLLVVFDAIYKHKSVSTAADSLGLSQPAVSNALRRLRTQINDPLFTKSQGGVSSTPTADVLAEVVPGALTQINDAIARCQLFNPFTSRRTFNLIMSDIGEATVLPLLVESCKLEAPHINFHTVALQTREAGDALAKGGVDLAVGFLPQLGSGLRCSELFSTNYVCIVRKGHPGAHTGVSKTMFCKADHALAEQAGTGHDIVEKNLVQMGLYDRIKLRVSSFLALPAIIASSDMIATIPRPLALSLNSNSPLTWYEHPLPLPEIDISLFWHNRVHKDPANQWLRKMMLSVFSNIDWRRPGLQRDQHLRWRGRYTE